ncbi:hypothetical protein BGW80DRAFT_865225 [Lactifluus volemus]|nr:hypothetical protein BGW80DRAFT_865225 [Lactifluus volemus]
MADAGRPELWPSITIKAVQGSFGRAALAPNGISEFLDTEPEFLNEFRSKLGQRRRIQSDADLSFFQENIPEFGEYFQHAPKDVEQSDSVSNIHVLCHLASAFLAKCWKSSVVNEDHVRYFFDELGSYFHSVFGLREHHAFHSDWPFSLIVNANSIEREGKHYRHTPRSDFHLSVDRLVSLLVEVQSEKSEGDRYRMLLQAACVARLGRQLLDDDESNPFIVVALYVKNNGTALRYLVFQPDRLDPNVSYIEDVQDWTQPSQLFGALFDMYNLTSVIQNERRSPGNIRNRIESLDAEV